VMNDTQETNLEEILKRTGGEPFLLYKEKDNFVTPVSNRKETGKLHIYHPTVDSLANRAGGPVSSQRYNPNSLALNNVTLLTGCAGRSCWTC
jgi:hypothetical protein